jgi:hypothetical protein
MAHRQCTRFAHASAGAGRVGLAGPTLLFVALAAAVTIAATEDRPIPPLDSISPAPGARVAGAAALGAVLNLQRGDVTDPSNIRVWLDGTVITQDCTVVATRDVPPSRVEVTCPLGVLEPGSHTAELRLGPTGLGYSHRWDFNAIAE